MTDNTQPEAVADCIFRLRGLRHVDRHEVARAMESMVARIADLEAQLEAIGAGGVSGPLLGRAALSANAGEPTEDVKQKIASNTWDHFGDILPTLKAISRGEWYWGANSRCKYIEIRLDTRDGGCLLYDRERVRISPEQFAHQHHRVRMEPWPAYSGFTHPSPPEGMVMVPNEPTEAMRAAAVKYAKGSAVYKNVNAEVLRIEEGIYGEVYEAMIAAAPLPPTSAEGVEHG